MYRNTTIWCIAVAGVSFCAQGHAASSSSYSFTKIDVQGASSTVPSGINDANEVIGSFVDTAGVEHAYLQSRDRVTIIAPPNATATYPVAINNNGQIAGTFQDGSGTSWGFSYDIPTAEVTVIKPDGATGCRANAVTETGAVFGVCWGANGSFAFRAHSGHIQTLVLAGIQNPTSLIGNGRGFVAGSYINHVVYGGAFVRSGGVMTLYTEPVEAIVPVAVNSSGDIVFYQVDGDDPNVLAWLRLANGRSLTLQPDGAVQTVPTSVNRWRQVVGNYWDQNFKAHGFYFDPGATSGALSEVTTRSGEVVLPAGINRYGNIVGTTDVQGHPSHAVLGRRP